MSAGTDCQSAAALIGLPPGFRSSLLEGLTPSEVQAVLATARLRRIFPPQVLQHEGEPAVHLSLVVAGRAAVSRFTPEGAKLFLRWLVPGDVFGLTTLQPERGPFPATVQAVKEGYVRVWDRASARALLPQYPQLAGNVYSAVANYLHCVIDVLVARASQNAQQRLARMLVESARQIGRAGPEGIEFDLTNEQLAEMADISLFTTSRQLGEWQRQGILTKRRGKILLRAPERLVSQHF